MVGIEIEAGKDLDRDADIGHDELAQRLLGDILLEFALECLLEEAVIVDWRLLGLATFDDHSWPPFFMLSIAHNGCKLL